MNRDGLTILIADTDPAVRASVARQFNAAGYTTETTDTGTDAIMQCYLDPPDVLIVSVDLPDIDGYEVCERVRREIGNEDMAIILLTHPSDEMTRTYAGQMVEYAGGDYFFSKPLDTHLLVQLVENVASSQTPTSQCERRASFPKRSVWPTARTPSHPGIGW